MIKHIMSDGYSSAGRAAIDFATARGIPYSGWALKSEVTSKKTSFKDSHLHEMCTKDYLKTVEQNVVDSDGTIAISHGLASDYIQFTIEIADFYNRPWLEIDINNTQAFIGAQKFYRWSEKNEIKTIAISGSESKSTSNVYRAVFNLFEAINFIGLTTGTHNLPDDQETPKTLDEAIKLLTANIPLRTKSEFSNIDEGDLNRIYFYFVPIIRIQFKLWAGNDELLEDCRKVSGDASLKPDDAASLIIIEIFKHLKKFHTLRLVQ